MRYVIIFSFLFSLAKNCLADSEASFIYSLEKYPELTKLLNDGEEYNGCGTFVDVVSDEEKVFKLLSAEGKELYLVGYINDCGHSWQYGSKVYEKTESGFHSSKIKFPYLYEIEVDSVNYSLHQESSQFSNNILSVKYETSCKNGDEYLQIGACASSNNYTVSIKYKFDGNDFIILEKTAIINEN